MGLPDNQSVLHLQRGFVEGVPRVGGTFLEEALEFVNDIGGDHDFWREQHAALDMSFFHEVVEVVQRVLQKHSDE